MANHFVHMELNTDNLDAAKAFYGKLFDWKIAPFPGMDYLGINTGSKTSGGGMQIKPMAEAPTSWMPYVGVDSVKKTLTKAQKLGATVVMPYTKLGAGMGAIGMFTDPSGATLGLYEAAKKPAKR